MKIRGKADSALHSYYRINTFECYVWVDNQLLLTHYIDVKKSKKSTN